MHTLPSQAPLRSDVPPHLPPDEPLPVARTHEELQRNLARLSEIVGDRREVPAFPETGCFPDQENTPKQENSETVLEEAARITSSDRNKTYGPPRDNHSRTAALWNAYLSGLNGRPLDYRDVCWLNVLQKASRDVFCRQRDSLVDGCGFLRNIEMAENDEGRA